MRESRRIGGAVATATLGLVILLGIALSLTVIGAIVGVPLIVVGALGLVGGILGGSAGLPFALLLGLGVGYGYYRSRLRRAGL